MSAGADNFLHQVKQAASQQTQDYAPFVYGHIASYDPTMNRVRLILPSVRDEDNNPVLTAWMPLGAAFAGNGYGLQVAPKGGAGFDNPTDGELCMVMRVDRKIGVGVVACMVFTQVNTPPFADLAPGEAGLMADGGSFIRLRQNKDIEVNAGSEGRVLLTGKDITLTSSGGDPVTLTAQGDVNVTAQGNATVTATGKAIISAPSIEAGNGGVLQPVKLADNTPSTVLKAQ